MDKDLSSKSKAELITEVARLRAGIRNHRDSTGQDLYWYHPDLWALLPEGIEPRIQVPDWAPFMDEEASEPKI